MAQKHCWASGSLQGEFWKQAILLLPDCSKALMRGQWLVSTTTVLVPLSEEHLPKRSCPVLLAAAGPASGAGQPVYTLLAADLHMQLGRNQLRHTLSQE